MGKDAEIQWYIGHAPKKHNIGEKRIENKVKGDDFHKV